MNQRRTMLTIVLVLAVVLILVFMYLLVFSDRPSQSDCLSNPNLLGC
jgi:uncharacterized alpha/beta hydrolase family protein